MNNDTCPCSDSCQSDIGLAAGIGVLVAGVVIVVAWLVFYYCYRNPTKFTRLHSFMGGSTKSARETSSHKYFAGNYFVDANDSYLLESGQPPVDFHYFNENNRDTKYSSVPEEGGQAQTPDGGAHRQLIQQSSQTSAALLQDTAASSNFSLSLGDRANFPILGCNDTLPAMAESTLSLRSNSTSAAMDLSFWPSLPGESNIDLRPPVLSARITQKGGNYSSEHMVVMLTVPADESRNQHGINITIGTSSRPEDQPELDQASSLVTSVYTTSPSVGVVGKCRLRVPLSCHLMDVDNNDESGYDTLPEVSNLTVMVNKSNGEMVTSEWNDLGPIADFMESLGETREQPDCPAGFVEFDVEGSAMYAVRCDSGIWVKSMCLSHFAAALDEDQSWALRVFLHRDKTVDYERVCQYAKEFNMMPVGMPQPFHLPQHSYVHVLISSITEGCALDSSSHGVLHGEGCWPNLEQPPYVEFRLRQVHGCLPLPLIRVRTDVVVADDFDNITFELLSQWSTKVQMKMDKKMPDSLISKTKSSGAWPWMLMSPWQQLTVTQVQQMVAILDRPLMGDQDYSTLAALLGYTEEQVKFFSLQRPSPTEALLKDLHTRIPVNRITDRLLVAMGRMGAVWLSDFLRQACRVDRGSQQQFEDTALSVADDTLPRRAASGIYSSIRRTLDGTLKLTDEDKRDSLGHYQRRVQRMSGRKIVTNRRTSAAASSASVAIYASTTLPRQQPPPPPTSDGPAANEQASPWSKSQFTPQDSVDGTTMTMGNDGVASDSTGSPEAIGPLISSQSYDHKHANLELTASGASSREKQCMKRGQSTSAIYSSTKVVMEKHGRLAQVLSPPGQNGAVYTVHHDPAAPHRAILQPAPYIKRQRMATSCHQSIGSPGINEQAEIVRDTSFVSRVAKRLTRTSSMPSTERSAKRKGNQRPTNSQLLDGGPDMTTSQTMLTSTKSEAPPNRRRRSPYEEHVVPIPPRKESLKK